MAAVVVSCVFMYGQYEGWLRRRLRWPRTLLVGLVAVVLTASVFINTDSAMGRLLIWRVTCGVVTDRPVFGGGDGAFLVHYMPYQADFFANNINHPTAVLADNVTYSFNEYLGFAAEYGLVGLWMCILLVVWLLRRSSPTCPYALCLVSLSVLSLFSYPFRYAFAMLVAVWCLACMARLDRLTSVCVIRMRCGVLFSIGLSVCLSVGLILAVRDIRFEYRWGQLTADAYLTGAGSRYEDLRRDWNRNPFFLYSYGLALDSEGRYEESVTVLSECERYFNDYDLQMSLGDSYLKISHLHDAESHYRLASQMCPGRFMPLYKLVEIYDTTSRREQALELANEIVDKPVKIPSATIAAIKMKMQRRIDSVVD